MFENIMEEYYGKSSEDEDILRYIRHINMRKNRVVRPIPSHFEIYDKKGFLQRFRLFKVTVHMLIEKIQTAV